MSAPAKVLGPPHVARLAVCAIFFANAVLYANWVSRIPAIREGLGLSDGQLGTALLGLAVGALCAFPLAGWAIGRFGSKAVTVTALLVMCAALPLTALANGLWTLALALWLLGAGNGATDVAMNAQAAEVEKGYARPIMSSFHALWSIGGLVGAALGGVIAARGVTPALQFTLASGGLALITLLAATRLLSIPPEGPGGPVFARLPRALLAVGLITFCAALAEGAMADWTAVYLRGLGAPEGTAVAGYVAFALAMIAGRLSGDVLKARWGAPRLALQGGLIATLGLTLALLIGTPWAAFLGFACVGWGASTIFPMAFSAAAASGVNPGIALAGVATLGYTGFLVGPAAIGWVAEASTLRLALGVVALLCALLALLSGSLRPRPV